MSLSARLSKLPFLNRFISHMSTPLFRNGYTLVLSSAITSGLGMIYWILAARSYTTEAIGLNSAVMSMMLFLANLSQLNLVNVLNRFIPRAGRATGRLVGYSYLISVMIAFAAGLIFLLGLNLWAPALGFLRASSFFIVWFTLATMAWCVFLLQDGVLTGLRQTVWVPIENAVFALAKIALLVLLATSQPQFGVLASWTIPLIASLLPVNLLVFWRLIPKHVRATKDQAEPIRTAQIGRFVAGNYFSSLVRMASISLLPIIVTERAGATANAYFYLSWTIAYSLYLVSRNMGMSLTTEGATDQSKLDIYSYRAFLQTARLLVPAVFLVVITAPYILRFFGESYATEGALLLRLLSLSALPNMVNSIYTSMARVRRRIGELILVQTSLSVLVFGLSILFLELHGISGIGLAWLLGQSIVAVLLLVIRLRKAWLPYLDVRPLLRLLAVPRKIWRRWSQRSHVAEAYKLLPRILPGIVSDNEAPDSGTWEVQSIVPTVGDIIVVNLGPTGSKPVALLKLPQSDSAERSLRWQKAVLAGLHTNTSLGEWRALLPELLADGEIAGRPYAVEGMLPGVDGRTVLSDPIIRMCMQRAAIVAIGELHRNTAVTVRADANGLEHRLERWIDKRLDVIRRALPISPESDDGQALDRLAKELHAALDGRKLSVCWVHGDFVPGNVLVTPDGRTVTGIVDWELAAADDLPQLDVAWFLMATRLDVQKGELGDLVRRMLQGDGWTPEERALVDAAQKGLTGDGLDFKTTVWLCWLRHVTGTLSKSTRYAGHWLWVSKNVNGVLRCL